MTSPSTATDVRAEEFIAAAARMGRVAERAGPLFAYLPRHAALHAELFAEVTLDVLEDARYRIRNGRLQPPTHRTRTVLLAGFSVRAFGLDRHCLVTVPDGPEADTTEATATLRRLMDAPDPSRRVVHLGEDSATYLDAVHVHTDPWDVHLVQEIADAAFAVEDACVQVRVRRSTRMSARSLAVRGDELRAWRFGGSTIRVDVSLPDFPWCTGSAVEEALSAVPTALALAAVASARRRASAAPVTAQRCPLVIGPGWGGVWLHEAVGHAAEADSGMQPEVRAEMRLPTFFQIDDDPVIPHGRGSYAVDDEGTPASLTPLVRDGRLVGTLTDRFFARARNLPATGNGRRASYRTLPLPRMSNLVVYGDSARTTDLLLDAEDGIFIASFREGCLHRVDGRVRLVTDESYRIRKGRREEALQDTTIDLPPAELARCIRAIGGDSALERGRGICVKAGQALPVGITAPSVLLDPVPIRPV